MAALNDLKLALRQAAKALPQQPLSNTQYSEGFKIVQDSEWTVYQNFIVPQLSRLLETHFKFHADVSLLEVGPGPQSLFSHLPDNLKRKFKTYTALEPNSLFAATLQEQFYSMTNQESPLPYLAHPAKIHRHPFDLRKDTESCTHEYEADGNNKYDLILFCHSMYGMKPNHKFIENALEMLVERPQGLVVVFHRDGVLRLQDLVCHRIASYPTGVVRVADDNTILDSFVSFIAGQVLDDADENDTVRTAWRGICRSLGRHEKGNVLFSAPNVMVTFTHHATTLPELMGQMPSSKRNETIKNREARLQSPATTVRPTKIRQVQECVRWALRYGFSLTIIGGGHSGHCLLSNVVSVDMSAFDKVHIVRAQDDRKEGRRDSMDASASLVVAEAGTTIGDIIRKTMAAGLTIPLGARPSVGAGLWLQGGIGHLARLHGLSCDAVVGAVIVSVDSGQILCIGNVPSQHMPAGAVRPEHEADLLWAIRGAGTNFGIVINVIFKAYAVATYLTRNTIIPMSNKLEAIHQLSTFDALVAKKLNRGCSADAYLYWDNDQLHLGVTTFERCTAGLAVAEPTTIPEGILLGSQDEFRVVDGIDLFETDMYMSGMHSGHGGGKTSSFKRCIFLKDIGEARVSSRLMAAIESQPSGLCYLHLLQGGGVIGDVEDKATAFGCRDWDFACVITGVWRREQDGTDVARAVQQWVYDVAEGLLPVSCGAYAADLGPDPRDAALAAKAFGHNLSRLVQLKSSLDPHNVLAYTCPFPRALVPKLIILVTGESCAGKDYCAEVWASELPKCIREGLSARAVSISDATKREYAAATGTDLHRLLTDRTFKEQHRPALTQFFQEQVRQRPDLPEEHFLNVVHNAVGVDVLLITGMRDKAPVATLSHLVPESRLIEVCVQAAAQTRCVRRGCQGDESNGCAHKGNNNSSRNSHLNDYRPTLVFDNDTAGNEAVEAFGERYLFPFLHQDLERLAKMVRAVPDFPRPGIEFRHVLGISQQPGGLALCTSLLREQFNGDWNKVGAVVCCEVGGLVNASALALQVGVPLILIREAGKLPPPTVSVGKSSSHISSMGSDGLREKRIEIERDAVAAGTPVVVVDDVLSTGETLCAVLELLHKAGISLDDISVMVVAEFPVHCGRELLRRRHFGKVSVQSLLVLAGA